VRKAAELSTKREGKTEYLTKRHETDYTCVTLTRANVVNCPPQGAEGATSLKGWKKGVS